jgi:hypothetical protein
MDFAILSRAVSNPRVNPTNATEKVVSKARFAFTRICCVTSRSHSPQEARRVNMEVTEFPDPRSRDICVRLPLRYRLHHS